MDFPASARNIIGIIESNQYDLRRIKDRSIQRLAEPVASSGSKTQVHYKAANEVISDIVDQIDSMLTCDPSRQPRWIMGEIAKLSKHITAVDAQHLSSLDGMQETNPGIESLFDDLDQMLGFFALTRSEILTLDKFDSLNPLAVAEAICPEPFMYISQPKLQGLNSSQFTTFYADGDGTTGPLYTTPLTPQELKYLEHKLQLFRPEVRKDVKLVLKYLRDSINDQEIVDRANLIYEDIAEYHKKYSEDPNLVKGLATPYYDDFADKTYWDYGLIGDAITESNTNAFDQFLKEAKELIIPAYNTNSDIVSDIVEKVLIVQRLRQRFQSEFVHQSNLDIVHDGSFVDDAIFATTPHGDLSELEATFEHMKYLLEVGSGSIVELQRPSAKALGIPVQDENCATTKIDCLVDQYRTLLIKSILPPSAPVARKLYEDDIDAYLRMYLSNLVKDLHSQDAQARTSASEVLKTIISNIVRVTKQQNSINPESARELIVILSQGLFPMDFWASLRQPSTKPGGEPLGKPLDS